MEKDIGKIPKKDDTEIIIRVDDFGGKRGLTIREFVTNDRYTGFTKAGTRIPALEFKKFKEIINSVSEEEMLAQPAESLESEKPAVKKSFSSPQKKPYRSQEELPDY